MVAPARPVAGHPIGVTSCRVERRGMIRTLWMCLVGGLLVIGFWRHLTISSATIDLAPNEYRLTYSVAWGVGMNESFELKRTRSLWPVANSGWVAVWNDPDNSGLVVYKAPGREVYYFGFPRNLFRFDASDGRLSEISEHEGIPPLTELGTALMNSTFDKRADIDPGAPRFPVGASEGPSTTPPVVPPASRYYRDLVYLGRFAVFSSPYGNRRGDGVVFVPAGAVGEPQLPLHPLVP